MKKTIKDIVKAISVCVYSVVTVVLLIIHFVNDTINKKKGCISNNRKKDDIAVLGNGPSLNSVDLECMKNQNIKLCCVNYYPLKKEEDFFRIKPEFLCLMDPGFFDYTIKAEEEDKKAFLDIIKKVDWNLRIIAPGGKKLPICNDNIGYEWVNTFKASYKCADMLKYMLYKKNLAIVGMQNVAIAATFYFLTANYNKLYITGVDLSDFKNLYVDENNRVYVDSTHLYGSNRYYYDEMPECGLIGFGNILGAYQNMFIEFEQLSKYAKYLDVEVVNLSIDSYIDVFKKEYPEKLGLGRK